MRWLSIAAWLGAICFSGPVWADVADLTPAAERACAPGGARVSGAAQVRDAADVGGAAQVSSAANVCDVAEISDVANVVEVVGNRASAVGSGWAVLPGLWFSTDRGLGASATALYYLPLDRDAERPSEIGIVALWTSSGDRVIRLAPKLRLKGGISHHIDGQIEVGQRGGSYYGLGNETSLSNGESFRRMRTAGHLSYARQLWGRIQGGVGADLVHSDISEREAGGALETGEVPGAEGGLTSGVGLLVRFDSRDRGYAARRGAFAQSSLYLYHRVFGSDYDYVRLRGDARGYVDLGRGHVVAAQAYGLFTFGEPPFERMPVAGGPKILRGVRNGRFRDRHLVAGQVEYRTPMWWRLGLAAFAATGRVGHELDDVLTRGWKLAAGGGLRVAVKRKDGLHLRADAGISADGYEIYIDILEAF